MTIGRDHSYMDGHTAQAELSMSPPCRITVKDLMLRYNISERTAVRWRRALRAGGVLVGVSPKSRSLVGDWRQVDQAVLLGMATG